MAELNGKLVLKAHFGSLEPQFSKIVGNSHAYFFFIVWLEG